VQTGVGQPLMQRKTSYFDQTCNEFISDWIAMHTCDINTVFILHSSYETLLIRQKCKQYILKWDAVG
jgi:hypothetical protein